MTEQMTTQTLLDKVSEAQAKVNERATKPHELDTRHQIEAACRFVAMHEADALLDGLTTKDMARMLVDGIAPGGPFLTELDLIAWVEGQDEASDGNWEWLDAAIDDHFGIRRGVSDGD